MSDVLVTIIVLVMMLVGLAGTLFPVLPGIVLMWVAAIAYGLSFGFDALGIGITAVISVLTVVALVLGVVLPKQAAAGAGASNKAQLAAGVGAIIGFFVIPVVGLVIGAVVVIGSAARRAGELRQRGHLRHPTVARLRSGFHREHSPW